MDKRRRRMCSQCTILGIIEKGSVVVGVLVLCREIEGRGELLFGSSGS